MPQGSTDSRAGSEWEFRLQPHEIKLAMELPDETILCVQWNDQSRKFLQSDPLAFATLIGLSAPEEMSYPQLEMFSAELKVTLSVLPGLHSLRRLHDDPPGMERTLTFIHLGALADHYHHQRRTE